MPFLSLLPESLDSLFLEFLQNYLITGVVCMLTSLRQKPEGYELKRITLMDRSPYDVTGKLISLAVIDYCDEVTKNAGKHTVSIHFLDGLSRIMERVCLEVHRSYKVTTDKNYSVKRQRDRIFLCTFAK